MKVDVHGLRKEAHHAENLRLKLKRELPAEEVEACATFAQLEKKKKLLEAIHRQTRHSRTAAERQALQAEVEAEEELPKHHCH